MNSLSNVIRILSWIFLPIAIVRFILEKRQYSSVRRLFHKVINTDDKFYNFLEALGFKIDPYFGRAYSIQTVDDPNIDEDMAYDIMMKTLLPFQQSFEQTGMIDVVSLITKEIEPKAFLCTLQPYNFDRFISRYVDLAISIVIGAAGILFWIWFF